MDRFQEFENLVRPIQAFLKENYNPHTAVVIDLDGAKVTQTLMCAPHEKSAHSAE